MADLPQELVDAIVEDVPESSLAACALTARAFVVSSQRRLFRWMSLNNISAYEKTARLLTSSPHIGPYFRYLALNIAQIPKDYVHLETILASLSELEYLSIAGNPTATRNQMAQNPCLVGLLSLPTLRCLALQDLIDIPRSLILQALLSFEQVAFRRVYIAHDPVESLSALNLWHLSVMMDDRDDNSILPVLVHPKQIGLTRQLQRLCVAFPPVRAEHQPIFKNFLVGCSSSLEYLTLELETPPTYLPTLPSLEVFELLIDVELTKTFTIFHSMIAGAVSSMPNLQVLIIAILDRPDGPHRPNRQRWAGNRPWEWADLDSTLLDDIPDLSRVEFSLRTFSTVDTKRYMDFVQFIVAHLPRAFNDGLLKFDHRPSVRHQMDTFVG
ncbi:hypothetical protein MSAN_00952600 [Mycena sanguinolenta]|uniref:F-box domain-containing protein n=1 Tax=Mycena sanguinolenta TaxID=230812 RepID=A0A8H7D978_9AGAR|nr:hypothetical protein MSAN_00952600 [Mycena sanguinolenta]